MSSRSPRLREAPGSGTAAGQAVAARAPSRGAHLAGGAGAGSGAAAGDAGGGASFQPRRRPRQQVPHQILENVAATAATPAAVNPLASAAHTCAALQLCQLSPRPLQSNIFQPNLCYGNRQDYRYLLIRAPSRNLSRALERCRTLPTSENCIFMTRYPHRKL